MDESRARAVRPEVTFFISLPIVDVMYISLSRGAYFLSGLVFYWGVKVLHLI